MRGEPGVHVTGIEVVGYCLKIELSDDATVSANLLPLLERFEQEKPGREAQLAGNYTGFLKRRRGPKL